MCQQIANKPAYIMYCESLHKFVVKSTKTKRTNNAACMLYLQEVRVGGDIVPLLAVQDA